MTELDLAAPLAAALEAKGYASLTPVQEAVLAPEAAGRDLLVSARTGSGKTVAFGLAIAPEVLAGADKLQPAEVPLALVIAPTRELALQVARELAWLYGEAGAQIATCVGGMDYRNERRALQRGAHIVVGTPGRLRDHIERGSLALSGLRACVLDEADEMLDLGFREDSGVHPVGGAGRPAHADVLGDGAAGDRRSRADLPARRAPDRDRGRGAAACRHRLSGAERDGEGPGSRDLQPAPPA